MGLPVHFVDDNIMPFRALPCIKQCSKGCTDFLNYSSPWNLGISVFSGRAASSSGLDNPLLYDRS